MGPENKIYCNHFSSLPTQYMPSSSWMGFVNQTLNQRPIFLVANEIIDEGIIESIMKPQSKCFLLSETFFFSKVRSLLDVKEDRIKLSCVSTIIDFFNDRLNSSSSFKQYVIKQVKNNNLSPKMLFEAIVYDQLIGNFAQKDIAEILWVEKTLEHSKHLDVIERFYPEAKIIFILKKSSYTQTNPDFGFCRNESKEYDRLIAQCFNTSEIEPLENYCFIQFSDLVKNKMNVIRKIESFIGKGWEGSDKKYLSPSFSNDARKANGLKINHLNKSMLSYHEWVFENIYDHNDLLGKQVLEIGGVPEQKVIAETLISNGAQKVVQINIRQSQDRKVTDGIEYVKMDARQTLFGHDAFDIVFGAAILEHMLDLQQFLFEMYRILKTGGIIVLHGGPLWGSAWGHHLWVDCGESKYRFNDVNPLPNWSHLYMDNKMMAEYLLKEGIPKAHANKIVHWCFESDEINRLMYEDYIKIFGSSLFQSVCFKKKRMAYPSREVYNKIKDVCGRIDSEIFNSELLVVAKKV